ncbi:hypothetical protein Trco_000351 [Trichoderma cornu-damae]|uniref:Uncharacterized protein n=1 Tax=Trichoderma cornu-damae TaxID=654480 RepID=A0A9P8QQ46_9HYPO|nr:hypothetical protein Trco_000351 [Trichoderma cornu-damae]
MSPSSFISFSQLLEYTTAEKASRSRTVSISWRYSFGMPLPMTCACRVRTDRILGSRMALVRLRLAVVATAVGAPSRENSKASVASFLSTSREKPESRIRDRTCEKAGDSIRSAVSSSRRLSAAGDGWALSSGARPPSSRMPDSRMTSSSLSLGGRRKASQSERLRSSSSAPPSISLLTSAVSWETRSKVTRSRGLRLPKTDRTELSTRCMTSIQPLFSSHQLKLPLGLSRPRGGGVLLRAVRSKGHPNVDRHADGALAIVLGEGGIRNAGRAGRLNALEAPRRALDLLDLVRDLLRIQGRHHVGRGGGQEGQDGKRAVFLVLLESTAEAGEHLPVSHATSGGLEAAGQTHFSLAMRSLLMRSRASLILDMTYCVAA